MIMKNVTTFIQNIFILSNQFLLLVGAFIFTVILLVSFYIRKKYIELEDEIYSIRYELQKLQAINKKLEREINEE